MNRILANYGKIAQILLGAIVLLVQGCAPVLIGGALVGGAMVVHDRRTTGSMLDDEGIEFKALNVLANDEELWESSHINVTSYNTVVLLSGEAPNATLRARAEELVSKINKVKRVHNEINIAAPSSFLSRSNDTLITTKTKSALVAVGEDVEGFDPTRVKVVTEDSTVYLMGLLHRKEAEAVVERVRRVGGVQRVVKIFEYID